MSMLDSLLGKKTGVINLSAEEFNEQFKGDDKAILIDTRTPEEYRAGHIPGAKLINIMDPEFDRKIGELDKEKDYYLYCRSGNRSYHAGRAMKNMGFEKVYNLEDGLISWNGDIE